MRPVGGVIAVMWLSPRWFGRGWTARPRSHSLMPWYLIRTMPSRGASGVRSEVLTTARGVAGRAVPFSVAVNGGRPSRWRVTPTVTVSPGSGTATW